MNVRWFAALAAFFFGAFALTATLAQDDAPQESGGGAGGAAFAVGGIRLDVRAKSVGEARDAAFREAPRQAWPKLWARLTGLSAERAPSLSDAALDAMIDSIEVERERFGDDRYIATLGVVFDRQRAGRRLPAGARILQSRPMLVLPVLVDAGAVTTVDADSPWFQAWQRFGGASSVIDYIRPKGTSGDQILLNGWQGARGDRRLWRNILTGYQAHNVLVAQARLRRSYPGGPISAIFVARHGPDSEELERFELRAANPSEIPEMMGTAVTRIDGIYARALQDGTIQADDSLSLALAPIEAPAAEIDDGFEAGQVLTATVVTPDAFAWSSMKATLDAMPQIEQATLQTLNIGGTSSVRIAYTGTYARLRYALDQRGVRLEPGEAGYRLRKRVDGEAALTAPVERVGIPIANPAPPPASRPAPADP
ncbi:MAG: hypothetical protein WA979_02070, partial [Pacificimonas sp.]